MKSLNKICLFIPSLEGGGAERVFLNLANYLEKNHINYNLLLGFKKGHNLNKILNSSKVFSLETRGRYYFINFFNYLRKEKPTKIYSTLLSANFCNSLSRLFFLKKSEHILREANIVVLPKNIIRKFFIILIYQFYYLANKIIVNSNDTKTSLLKIVPYLQKKIYVIPNPVFFEKEIDKISTSNRFNNSKIFNFIGIGRLVDQKNFQLLILAFNIVQKTYNSRLIIAGNGFLKDKLIKLTKDLKINKKITFLDYQNNISNLFDRKSIFVLSSKYEGFGNVVVEALMNGVPVVSTDCPGGPLEILNNGEFGYIAEQNYHDLSKNMIRALIDHKNKKINYIKLKNRALDYTVEKIAVLYLL